MSAYQLKKKYTAASKAEYLNDGKYYSKKTNGYGYVENAEGEYAKVNVTSQNIVVTKEGKTDKQIIVGMHYDGTGTGDNGSGVALGLTTAEKFFDVETQFTIKFVFFTAEEYGLYGSTAYAESMTDAEKANTPTQIIIRMTATGLKRFFDLSFLVLFFIIA